MFSRPPFWSSPGGKKTIWGIIFLISFLVIGWKFLFDWGSEEKLNVFTRKGFSGQARGKYLPFGNVEERALLFGGALNKVRDFADVEQDKAYWMVLRDIKRADPGFFEDAPLILDDQDLLADPQFFRSTGTPLKVRGVMDLWWAKPAGENDAGVEAYYRSWFSNGESGYVCDSWERPPVDEEGFQRIPIEINGFFYQIYRYKTATPLRSVFFKAVKFLKWGSYESALKELQRVLDQDPRPVLVAQWLQKVNGELWKPFKAEGGDFAAVVGRLDALGAKGLGEVPTETEEEQYVMRDAPFFIAKSIRRLGPGGVSSAFDRFMGTGGGLVAFLGALFLVVGGFVYFFFRLQRASESKLRKERKSFWREARRNVKK